MKRSSVLAVASAIAMLATSQQAVALNIVLTDDDGWAAIGIQAMKKALVEDGHNVFLVAPVDEQSGSSAAINTGSLKVVKQRVDEGAQEYSVALADGSHGAEPATTAAVGIGLMKQATGAAPDLVVSGINAGQNLGAATQISGTVGAVIAAISTAFGGDQVPGIAISTDNMCADATDACKAENEAHYYQVARFTADLIAKLQERNRHGELMPQGIGLNINYPALETVKGVKVSRQGQTFTSGGTAISLTYGCYADCLNASIGAAIPAGITGYSVVDQGEVKNADTTNNANGYVTIVPIAPDYTADLTGSKLGIVDRFCGTIETVVRKIRWRY